ncbi:MAG TPA: hypothetical protein VIK74_02900 [Parasegetibacter sp.]
MNLSYQQFLPSDFAPSSRVWIYQSSRLFSISEALQIEEILENFVADWKAHGAGVKGYANLLFGQFLVLIADETTTHVSGCSTDSSVRMVKKIEELFNVNMFDRQSLAFFVKEKVEIIPMQQVKYALQNGFITPDTLYFNNLVSTKEQLENEWIIPVSRSWITRLYA